MNPWLILLGSCRQSSSVELESWFIEHGCIMNEYSKFYDLHNLFYTLTPWLQDICIHPPLTLECFEKPWAEIN